mmetsp:Transcript_12435/g.35586  ORF Transcript_12435/g.35586 Transcript_12435/m.35586 type:complete len:163 (-) Transcript_12435:167-655(-)
MVAGETVGIFSDVHRWLAIQAEEIEMLRSRHRRLTVRRKDTIQNVAGQLSKDVVERKTQVNEFSLDLEQYTLRKFDLLKDDLVAAHLASRHEAEDHLKGTTDRKHHQIHRLCKNLDILHHALLGVNDKMVDLVDNCCTMTKMEEMGLTPPPVAVAMQHGTQF